MQNQYDGGCTCSTVRYRMKAAPMYVHCCHCRWCQRETGGAFAVNALIETDQIEVLQGEVENIDTPSSSGQGQRIARCPKCHIALWSHYAYAGIRDRVRFLRTGTLDVPDAFAPDIHIFVESKQPWVIIPADAVAVDQYYRAAELWSAESLARRDALRS